MRLHTHLAETSDEEEFCVSMYGRRPLRLMEDCGFVGKDVWYAHGIFFDDDELEILARTSTGVAHCPSSNMRLGSGIARVREMLDSGVSVGLGVDGSASNDSSDMLGEARQAMLLQRDPLWLRRRSPPARPFPSRPRAARKSSATKNSAGSRRAG